MRKLLLMAELGREHHETEKRLLGAAEVAFSDLVDGRATKATEKSYGRFWLDLYDAFIELGEAITVVDQDQFRVDAAKLIFNAEEYVEPEPIILSPLMTAFHENGIDWVWL